MYESTVVSKVVAKRLPGVLDEYAHAGWRIVTVIDTLMGGTSMNAYTIVFERSHAVTA